MDDVREILRKAIEKEVITFQEYLEAAQKTMDPAARSLLRQLAQDETRHRQILDAQLALMGAGEIYPPAGEKGAMLDLDLEACKRERKGATEVPAEAKWEIEQIQQAREELYVMVTHDLRSPLISIEALAKKLLSSLQKKITDKDLQKLQLIWKEARRLEGFVSRFLDLALLASYRGALKREPVDPRAIIEEALEILLPQAKEKGVRVEVKTQELRWVEGDPWGIKRVFMNLLDNAMLHGRVGGKIKVGATEENRTVRFWVKDDGPGIPEKDLPHIFERFHTGAAGRRGSGLGLAIARQVVEAHGGRIWPESKEGEGATFYFTLPKAHEEKKATE
jgi:signal transduction histidine kinase